MTLAERIAQARAETERRFSMAVLLENRLLPSWRNVKPDMTKRLDAMAKGDETARVLLRDKATRERILQQEIAIEEPRRRQAAGYALYQAEQGREALWKELQALREISMEPPDALTAWEQAKGNGASRQHISDETELLIQLLAGQEEQGYRAELETARPSEVQPRLVRASSDPTAPGAAAFIRVVEGWRPRGELARC